MLRLILGLTWNLIGDVGDLEIFSQEKVIARNDDLL